MLTLGCLLLFVNLNKVYLSEMYRSQRGLAVGHAWMKDLQSSAIGQRSASVRQLGQLTFLPQEAAFALAVT